MSNYRIKIVQKGWEGYTGAIGPTEFVEGVSVAEIDQMTADRIGANLQIERALADGEEGETAIGVQQRMIDAPMLRLDAVEALVRADEVPEEEVVIIEPEPEVETETKDEDKELTLEDLTKVADDKGIAGLREIADPMGVKGRAIPALIEGILEEQALRKRQESNRLQREGE